jgi:choline monooxygenase
VSNYHGWTYGVDGLLRFAPQTESEPSFDHRQFSLISVGVAEWGELIFVRIIGDDDFASSTEKLRQHLARSGIDPERCQFRTQVQLKFACNWKVFVSNACEVYHIRTVHPKIGDTHFVEPGTYATEFSDVFSYYRNPPKNHTVGLHDWETWDVWPNLEISRWPAGSIGFRTVTPLNPGESQVVSYFAFEDGAEDMTDKDAESYRFILGVEDRHACEASQAGLATGVLPEGGLRILACEPGIEDFYRRLDKAFS